MGFGGSLFPLTVWHNSLFNGYPAAHLLNSSAQYKKNTSHCPDSLTVKLQVIVMLDLVLSGLFTTSLVPAGLVRTADWQHFIDEFEALSAVLSSL
jgi:hypothetical protein